MKPTNKNGYLSFSRNTKELKAVKEALRAEGYPIEKSREFIRSLVKAVDLPKNAVLIPAPSTTGTNILPLLICQELAKKRNIPIIHDLLSAMNETKAANKGGIGKLRDPVRIGMIRDPEELRGKTVYVVDDVVTTGETTDAMRECLATKGVYASGVICAGQSEQRIATATDLKRITEKLGDPPMTDEVRTLLGGRLKHKSNYIEREINERTRTEIRHLIGLEAKRLGQLDEGTRGYLARYSSMAARLQSREGR